MNKLAGEKSPYLLQHADNPVDWYPWGEEAFAKAQRENKPIFLSIGYSTCHWCHVMAHESFEDPETAALMNQEFVNVKVDREERPDVDRIYMTFVQATTGSGGWPMSVWLTPEREPFVGGTYFPPEDRYGHPAFRTVLRKIATLWKDDQAKLKEQGSHVVQALREARSARARPSGKVDVSVLEEAFEQLAEGFDAVNGGFGGAPKFPHPVTLNFLSRFYARELESESGKRALEMFLFTLRKMAAGGMHDHIGGGFHRYSVDRFWHVPHFEKMLYDQAQLASACLDAWQITGDLQYESVVRDILDYVSRDMTSSGGGFYSAEDADSALPVAAVSDRRKLHEQDGDAQRAPLQKKVEGAFYVWTEAEIDQVLGEDAPAFKLRFGVEPHGNTPPGSDPHGELQGKNVLIERATLAETAQRFDQSEKEIEELLGRAREKLLREREKRPRPHLDDKIITAWNGLMISAFARAGAILRDRRYLEAARAAANFIRESLYDEARKILFRSYRESRSAVEGFADDCAFMIQGLLDLYEATLEDAWLRFAFDLQETQDRFFWDDEGGGYFSTSGKDENLVLRMKDESDSAEPASSSVSALNLLRLGEMSDRDELRQRAAEAIDAFSLVLTRFPISMPQMLVALDFRESPKRQVVIAGEIDAADTRSLLAEAHRPFIPHKVLLGAGAGDDVPKSEAVKQMKPVSGKAAAYVCENFTCQAPVTETESLSDLLAG